MANARCRDAVWATLSRCGLLVLACALPVAGGCSQRTASDNQHLGPLHQELALYVLVERGHAANQPLDKYVANFEAGGQAPDGYKWLEIPERIGGLRADRQVLAHRGGSTYALASTAPDASLDSRTQWRVVEMNFKRGDRPYGGALTFRLDEQGANQLREVTRTHQGQWLAVCLGGEVETVANIRSVVGAQVQVTGDSDDLQAFYRKWKS